MGVDDSLDGLLLDKPKEMDEDALNAIVEKAFKFVRAGGLDVQQKLSMGEKAAEFRLVQKCDWGGVLDGVKLQGSAVGLNLAWSYFPHRYGIKCNEMKTFKDVFNDDALLKRALWKMLRRRVSLTTSGFRYGIGYFSGTQLVSNFRPSVAGFIYKFFSGDGVVWDMSSGFGGRLLAAFAVPEVLCYIGTDPSTLTFEGLLELKDDMLGLMPTKEVILEKVGSEDYLPPKGMLDLCFTSPPYFNTEQYSDESTQSFLKFPTANGWLNGFMGQTLNNCYHGLKRDGVLVLNVAGVQKYKNMAQDVCDLAASKGFVFRCERKYVLNSVSKGGRIGSEPVFFFSKDPTEDVDGERWFSTRLSSRGYIRRRLI